MVIKTKHFAHTSVLQEHHLPDVLLGRVTENVHCGTLVVLTIAKMILFNLFFKDLVLGEHHHEATSLIQFTLHCELHLDFKLFVLYKRVENVGTATVSDLRVQLHSVVQFESIAESGVCDGPSVSREIK